MKRTKKKGKQHASGTYARKQKKGKRKEKHRQRRLATGKGRQGQGLTKKKPRATGTRKTRRKTGREKRPFAGIFGLKTRYEFPRKERAELLRRVLALRKRVGVEE